MFRPEEGQAVRNYMGNDMKAYHYHLNELKSHYKINELMVEELLQEAALGKAKAIETYKETGACNLKTWTNKNIGWAMKDYLKVHYQKSQNDLLYNDEITGSKSTNNLLFALNEAIDELLTDQESKVLKMAYFEGWEHNSIGKHLGITSSNSRKILERALNKLKADEVLKDFWEQWGK